MCIDVRVLQSWLKRLGRHWLIDYQCLYRVKTLKCKNGLVTIHVYESLGVYFQ